MRVVTCVFGERSKGKIVERGTLCKMARGQMVRWLTERQVTKAVDVRDFDGLGYAYDAEYSTPDELVFLRKEPFASRHGFVAVLANSRRAVSRMRSLGLNIGSTPHPPDSRRERAKTGRP